MKILIIEDEILIQKSLSKMLSRMGAEVDATHEGSTAIKLIAKNSYDRIICDLMLSDISGFDVIEESKKKYQLNEIAQKFIIMTAYTSQEVINKASQYGCKILHKPFENIQQALEIMYYG
jgi:DNA-binding response OmpR family regulator